MRVFDCGETEGHYYIVMEFVDGQSLADHIDERQAVPVARALQIAEAVARALGEALDQVGVIHRDIKPANILLTSSGAGEAGRPGPGEDRGATGAPPTRRVQTAAGLALGTPSYMSPEQFADASQVDHRADIFSLGATLYHMLSGEVPFKGDSLFSLLKQVEEAEPRPAPVPVPAAVEETRRPDDGQAAGGPVSDLRGTDRSAPRLRSGRWRTRRSSRRPDASQPSTSPRSFPPPRRRPGDPLGHADREPSAAGRGHSERLLPERRARRARRGPGRADHQQAVAALRPRHPDPGLALRGSPVVRLVAPGQEAADRRSSFPTARRSSGPTTASKARRAPSSTPT